MDKDFARGERMMRRPDLQQRETQLQTSSEQRGRIQPSWAKKGSAWDTSDDDVLPPIPEHLKTNAWMKRWSKATPSTQDGSSSGLATKSDPEKTTLLARGSNPKAQQPKVPVAKRSYGDKLVDAAKMVPDLLKGDAKAAFKALTTDPVFVGQLVGVAAVFAVAQATPAGPFINAALIAVLGFSGGLSLANYLLKAHSAKNEAGLKASAEELKNLVEIVGLAALSGALRTASKVLGGIKGGATAQQAARKVLFSELTKAGIKFTPANIVKIARGQDGKIVFLEKGRETVISAEGIKKVKGGGLAHIMEKSQDFINRGIPKNRIADAVFDAVTKGSKIGIQGKSRGVYEINFDGKKQYISVDIGSNGFIVGANPTDKKLVNKLLGGNK